MDKRNEFSRMREVFFALCKSIDTPISLGAWLRFQHNQLALAEMRIDPRHYQDVDSFRKDYLVTSFLSKWKGLKTGIDLESVAVQSFITSENQCKESNVRLRKARTEAIDPLLSSVMYTAKVKIAKLLGPFSNFCIDPWYGWGPGATDDMRRSRAFVDLKLCELPISVTRDALPLIKGEIELDLHWSSVVLGVGVEDLNGPFCLLDNVFVVTDVCVIDTVPKSAKTHRVIAKEPRANGFLQKGFGGYIRRRLKRVGIDLDDQTPNQRGASRAIEDGLATLDLKAASDSLPIELVYELLPVEWAYALDCVRSKKALLPDGRKITLQKFSSMGNGFTFELETLIFWAITSSVAGLLETGGEVLVYGDDIICRKTVAPDVVRALAFCGFSTNLDKSFLDGSFYESCGKHYFQGRDVTPVYQKNELDSPFEIIRCGNRLLRCAYRFSYAGEGLAPYLESSWRVARRLDKSCEFFQIPLGTEGDDGWLVPADDFHPRPQDVNLGLRCIVARSPSKRFPAHEGALLAWTLRRGVVTDSPYNGDLTSSPETTASSIPVKGYRWVMPTGEFGLNW